MLGGGIRNPSIMQLLRGTPLVSFLGNKMWEVVRFGHSVPSHPSLPTSSFFLIPLVTTAAFSFCNCLESLIPLLGSLRLLACSTCHNVTSGQQSHEYKVFWARTQHMCNNSTELTS